MKIASVALAALLVALLLAAPASARTKTLQASAGAVAARVTWRALPAAAAENVRFSIARAGQPLVQGLLDRRHQEKPVALRVQDLDGDGEPEVLLDLFSGGAHCCLETLIYRFLPDQSGYARSSHVWGDLDYRLEDQEGDGRPELVSGDDAFAYEFTAYAFSAFPIQVWRLENARLVDVTRAYPALAATDAAGLLAEYRREVRRRDHEVRGILAAYLADQFLQDKGAEGWQVLCTAYRRGDLRGFLNANGARYLRSLRHFLRARGYIPPGPAPIPCLP